MRYIIKCHTLSLLISLYSIPIFSQEISTIGEIYNFEVGDLFHYHYSLYLTSYGESSYRNVEILDRYYSQNNDTLFYIRDIDYQVKSNINPTWTFDFYIDTIWYSDLNSLIYNGYIDSVYSNINYYNGRIINYWKNTTTASVWTKEFVNGCGKALYSNEDWEEYWVEQSSQLIYYKKGDDEWGTPINVSINENIELTQHILFYPNPAKNYIEINMPDFNIVEISILSLTGQRLITEKVISNFERIDISNLISGIYLINFKIEDHNTYRKLIVE